MSLTNLSSAPDLTIHYIHHGACITATASKSKIHALEAMAIQHDIRTKVGACLEPPLKCTVANGFRVCGSEEGAS